MGYYTINAEVQVLFVKNSAIVLAGHKFANFASWRIMVNFLSC